MAEEEGKVGVVILNPCIEVELVAAVWLCDKRARVQVIHKLCLVAAEHIELARVGQGKPPLRSFLYSFA